MRFAVFFTPPPDDPLTMVAARWLGRDAHSDHSIECAAGPYDLIEAPARYGFHGTLKAPFRLAPGRTEEELFDAFADFCLNHGPVSIPKIVLSKIGPFFALTPDTAIPELAGLAADAVEAFEPFRAALTPSEIEKRNPVKLTARQNDYLRQWGYPYVLSEFRFHMTLTGPVPEIRSDKIRDSLEKHFKDHLGYPLKINSCSIFIEPAPGEPLRVHLTSRLGS